MSGTVIAPATPGPLVQPKTTLGWGDVDFGVVSDIKSAYTSWTSCKSVLDVGGAALSTYSAASSAVNTFIDPLAAIIRIGVGWVIDWLTTCVKPVKDVVDALLGSPEAIAATEKEWQKIGKALCDAQITHANLAKDLTGWKGDTAAGYAKVQAANDELFTKAGEACDAVGRWVSAAGIIITAVREFIMDLLKDVITELVEKGLIAAAAAVPSLGSALAAYTAWAAGKISWLGMKTTEKLMGLMRKIAGFLRKIGVSQKHIDKVFENLNKSHKAYEKMGKDAARGKYGFNTDTIVEDGLPGSRLKKDSDAARDQIFETEKSAKKQAEAAADAAADKARQHAQRDAAGQHEDDLRDRRDAMAKALDKKDPDGPLTNSTHSRPLSDTVREMGHEWMRDTKTKVRDFLPGAADKLDDWGMRSAERYLDVVENTGRRIREADTADAVSAGAGAVDFAKNNWDTARGLKEGFFDGDWDRILDKTTGYDSNQGYAGARDKARKEGKLP